MLKPAAGIVLGANGALLFHEYAHAFAYFFFSGEWSSPHFNIFGTSFVVLSRGLLATWERVMVYLAPLFLVVLPSLLILGGKRSRSIFLDPFLLMQSAHASIYALGDPLFASEDGDYVRVALELGISIWWSIPVGILLLGPLVLYIRPWRRWLLALVERAAGSP
ncbi:MAG: hypothetical protein HYV77_02715 [Candidatus Wildermuthbacteria bacterium]|nr:hypothetical protein [Candidatus Wildermuthbacteria bacterium]